MLARNIIIYLRLSESEAVLVDSSNKALSSNKYPVAYYSEKPLIKLRPLKINGEPYSIAEFNGYTDFEFGIDIDFNRNTQPAVFASTTDTNFSITEQVENSITYCEISFKINCFTTSLESKLGIEKNIEKNVWAELSAFNFNELQPSLIIQFPFTLKNKLIDINTASPEEPPINYYKKTIIDNLLSAINNDITAINIIITDINNSITALQNSFNNYYSKSEIDTLNIGINNSITALQTELQNKVNIAPSDGKLYAMKDGQWVEITTATESDNLNNVTNENIAITNENIPVTNGLINYLFNENINITNENTKIAI